MYEPTICEIIGELIIFIIAKFYWISPFFPTIDILFQNALQNYYIILLLYDIFVS